MLGRQLARVQAALAVDLRPATLISKSLARNHKAGSAELAKAGALPQCQTERRLCPFANNNVGQIREGFMRKAKDYYRHAEECRKLATLSSNQDTPAPAVRNG